MKAWWVRLTVREQSSVLVLAVAVAVWLLWVALWSPMAAKRDRMAEQNSATAETLVRVDALSALVLQAREGNTPVRSGSNLAAVVNQSTARYGLSVSRLQPGARGDLQVRLENARFADLAAWLHQLEMREGLVFAEVAGTPVAADGLSGTVWSGRASRVRVSTDAGILHLGEVTWSLRPLSLLLAAPTLRIHSRWSDQELAAVVAWRGEREVILSDVEARFDAALLRHLAPIALTGRMTAQAETLHLRDGLPLEATARLTWQQAAWDSPQGLLPLGSYAADIRDTAPGVLAGTIVTLAGPLRAEGELQLRQRDYSIAILLTHDESWDPLLQEALALLARPVAAGYDLRLDGSLPQ